MEKQVSIRVVTMVVLASIWTTILFGWLVKSEIEGEVEVGPLGEVALMLSSFPTITKWIVEYHIFKNPAMIQTPREQKDLSAYVPVKSRPGLNVKGLMMKRSEGARLPRGWRVLVGAFSINDDIRHAALAISPDFEIAHVWDLNEDGMDDLSGVRPVHLKMAHGFDMASDGSVLFTFDAGQSIQRVNRCNQRVWHTPGLFNHSVKLTEDERFLWTINDSYKIEKLDANTGKVVKSIHMLDIARANPDIDIFEIRKLDYSQGRTGNERNTTEKWADDPFHLNDVDPLPASLAKYYPGFKAGDVALSSRSLNLIFVVDPDTLKVKWWRFGAVKRQHDPDWNARGTITVYNNRLGQHYSEIIELNPASYERKTILDGRKIDFYSRIRGKHQELPSGHLIVTSAQQGRVFEIDSKGNHVLDFINTVPGSSDVNFLLTDAKWFAPDTLNFDGDTTCKN